MEADKAERWIESEDGATPAESPRPAASNIKRLNAYLAGLARDAAPLPATSSRPTEVNFRLVALEAGIGIDCVSSADSRMRKIVLDRAAELGVAVRLRPRRNDAHTLEDLERLATARRRDELEKAVRESGRDEDGEAHKCDWAADCRPLVDAIRHAAKTADVRLSAPAAPALSEALRQPSRHETELRRAQHYLKEAQAGLGAPETFHGLLKFESALRGVSPYALGACVGYRRQDVLDWAEGRSLPDAAGVLIVEKIEKFLGLPKGALVDALPARPFGRIPLADLPPEAATTRYETEKLKRALPEDFRCRPEEEKRQLVAKAKEMIAAGSTSKTAKITRQRHDKYLLQDWPPELEQEWNNLVASRKPAIRLFGHEDERDGWRSDGSIEFWRSQFARFFGFLTNRLEEWLAAAPDKSWLPTRCLRLEELDFALLTEPALVAAFLSWLVWRAKQFDRPGRVSATDLAFIEEIERLCRYPRGAEKYDFGAGRPKVGYLAATPALAQRLNAIPSEVSPHDRAMNWMDRCERMVQFAQFVHEDFKNGVPLTDDPRERITGLLLSENPLACVQEILEALRAEHIDPYTIAGAQRLRARVEIGIAAENPLRPATFAKLLWSAREQHIVRTSDGWAFRAPRELFKNRTGPHFISDRFEKPISDLFGLHESLALYVQAARPTLVQAIGSDPGTFFVTPKGEATPGQIRADFLRLTSQFLENRADGSGYDGIRGFGPAAFRHLVATTILKKTGRLDLAAAAIHATPGVVYKHYARYMSPGLQIELHVQFRQIYGLESVDALSRSA